jgi:NitT/TauT family transport system substrate-binding protein
VVTVFLLHACGKSRVRTQASNRNQTSAPRDLESRGFLRGRPERAARMVAERGYPYEYALQTMREIRYAKWREYDPEDAVRFYALRLHEAGIIKSNPKKIIAQGTDWRLFNELKRELKG